MKTLSIVSQPAPAYAPDLDMTDVVAITARAVPKRGDEFSLCNPMDELIVAMENGYPFVAHSVVGMRAKQVIIMPDTIARIEEA